MVPGQRTRLAEHPAVSPGLGGIGRAARVLLGAAHLGGRDRSPEHRRRDAQHGREPGPDRRGRPGNRGRIRRRSARQSPGIQFTYYNKLTRGAILERDLPPSSGFTGAQFVNAGEITNSGLELSLNAQLVETPGLSWDLGLNFSSNSSEILQLSGEAGDTTIVFNSWSSMEHRVGHPPLQLVRRGRGQLGPRRQRQHGQRPVQRRTGWHHALLRRRRHHHRPARLPGPGHRALRDLAHVRHRRRQQPAAFTS